MQVAWKPRQVDRFNVGDYVMLKDPRYAGVVYKVDEADYNEQFPGCTDYKLRPVYGAFGCAERRGNRVERPDDMVLVDVVKAGLEHLKMLDFIKNLVNHYGEDLPE